MPNLPEIWSKMSSIFVNTIFFLDVRKRPKYPYKW